MASWKFLVILVLGFVSLNEAKGKGKTPPKDIPLRRIRDVDADSEVICETLKADPNDLKYDNVSSPTSYEDILTFMTYGYKLKLGDGVTKIKIEDFKRPVIDVLARIFSIGCPNEFVPTSFVNTVRELFAVFINKRNSKPEGGSKEKLKEALPYLEDCANQTIPLALESRGFEITGFYMNSNRKRPELLTIFPPRETMDDLVAFPERIIDSFWWFFSFSFGRCYPYFKGNRAVQMSELKTQFFLFFLQSLTERWKMGPEFRNSYGPIFGNIPLERVFANLRYCTTAAYLETETADRQLVRPVTFAGKGKDELGSLNKKTGQVWRPNIDPL